MHPENGKWIFMFFSYVYVMFLLSCQPIAAAAHVAYQTELTDPFRVLLSAFIYIMGIKYAESPVCSCVRPCFSLLSELLSVIYWMNL